MSAEQFLYAIGDIQEDFIREAAPGTTSRRQRKWLWTAVLAACLATALLLSKAWPTPAYSGSSGDNPAGSGPSADGEASADPGEPGAGAPAIELDGVTYVISGWFEHFLECPEGFAYTGETVISCHDGPLPYYTSPEHPEWIYVYQECWDQRKQQPYMAYVRYVEEVLRGLTLVRYQGTVYVFLNDTYYFPYQTEVSPEDQARYDAVPYDSVLKELPAGFESVGKTVLDGHDLVPFSELGSNSTTGQQVLANPAQPDILLLRHYWSGLEEPDYWVFVRYQG